MCLSGPAHRGPRPGELSRHAGSYSTGLWFDELSDGPDEAEEFTTDDSGDRKRRLSTLREPAIAWTETMLNFHGGADGFRMDIQTEMAQILWHKRSAPSRSGSGPSAQSDVSNPRYRDREAGRFILTRTTGLDMLMGLASGP
ncbi:MAG: hypothetical protein NVS4B2_05800 [Chloroflexota bacterium]